MEINPYKHHPHDALFRRNFSHREIFCEFLDHVLPAELINLLDKETLVIEPSSFVDKEQRDHFSDISATMQVSGQKTHVYLLMEHKSYNDPMALLQILRYMQLKWTGEVEEAKGKKVTLTPIIPILFHHGSNKNPPTQFSKIFADNLPASLKAYQPEFVAALYNLTTTQDEKISASPDLSSVLLALKYSRSDIDKFFDACGILIQKYGRDFLENIVFLSVKFYILSVTKENPEEVQRRYLEKINSPELKEAFMSTAEMLIEKGLEKGLEQGLERGREEGKEEGIEKGSHNKALETARKMFEEGLDLDMISRITGLTEEELIKIRDNSL